MATGGLRIGEAVALQVGDLDGAGRLLHIRRMVRRGYVSSAKNGKGRVVDIPASPVAVLEKIRETRQAEAAHQGTEARWLFPAKIADMPVTPETVQCAFSKTLRAAGIRRMRPHDLRQAYATLAIQAGVPLLTVSRQLGHASIGTTVDLHTHAVPGSNRAPADAMEGILTSKQRNPRQPALLTRYRCWPFVNRKVEKRGSDRTAGTGEKLHERIGPARIRKAYARRGSGGPGIPLSAP
jgi:integrase